jgi:hypothetical protein
VKFGEEEGRNEGWLPQGAMRKHRLLPIMKKIKKER